MGTIPLMSTAPLMSATPLTGTTPLTRWCARCVMLAAAVDSTVMHLLLRFYDPLDGRLTLGGVPFPQLNFKSMHARIGCVSQETQVR